ncbi:hypothetical protein [Saccharopolyspora elongata]|uniref:hypothetical protein n=1 Tax=Saccharopolyspora elongata TaxID=2530387 RepID=UPI001404350E|nr:hypothetical protein [Saccharopolyspora elongata]
MRRPGTGVGPDPRTWAREDIDAISRRAALLTEADPALIGAVVELAARWGRTGGRHRPWEGDAIDALRGRGVAVDEESVALSMRAGRAVLSGLAIAPSPYPSGPLGGAADALAADVLDAICCEYAGRRFRAEVDAELAVLERCASRPGVRSAIAGKRQVVQRLTKELRRLSDEEPQLPEGGEPLVHDDGEHVSVRFAPASSTRNTVVSFTSPVRLDVAAGGVVALDLLDTPDLLAMVTVPGSGPAKADYDSGWLWITVAAETATARRTGVADVDALLDGFHLTALHVYPREPLIVSDW